MKCTNKHNKTRLLCVILCIAALFMTGCSRTKEVLDHPYTLYNSTSTASSQMFAQNLCVTENIDYGTDQVSSQLAAGAGVFNLQTKEVTYSQNLFGKLYPASTTKILTAYMIIRDGNLDDKVTVSKEAVEGMAGSSVCGISEGDVLTVRDLLYGLMLVSGNDAANALAEYHSGSIAAFVEDMNKEVLALGATNSHFANANGLPDEEHYTTIYDMYLIFRAAIMQQDFVNIIKTGSYDAAYTDKNGNSVTKTWNNTNKYINGENEAPEGITVIGGKTGTTNAAGYCLVLYSTNKKGEDIISIVFKADGRSNLYTLMDQILSAFAN